MNKTIDENDTGIFFEYITNELLSGRILLILDCIRIVRDNALKRELKYIDYLIKILLFLANGIIVEFIKHLI